MTCSIEFRSASGYDRSSQDIHIHCKLKCCALACTGQALYHNSFLLRLTALELVGCPSLRAPCLCYDLLFIGLHMRVMLTVLLYMNLAATQKYHLDEALSNLRGKLGGELAFELIVAQSPVYGRLCYCVNTDIGVSTEHQLCTGPYWCMSKTSRG
jgi:hypothetical protein